jgi:hypothetical protein
MGVPTAKSVTLRPQPGGETTKSIRDMWWHWEKKVSIVSLQKFTFPFIYHSTADTDERYEEVRGK